MKPSAMTLPTVLTRAEMNRIYDVPVFLLVPGGKGRIIELDGTFVVGYRVFTGPDGEPYIEAFDDSLDAELK
jgi:hypothetical protein